jgi:cysteinyl-tRNA synthetase
MSARYLGEEFDIHAGGLDLIFPHHENEIAQSEAATGKPFVKYWLHCDHLIVDGQKMSKSLGNFYTLRDILEKGYKPVAIRYLLLSTHYRQKVNFTFRGLDAAWAAIQRLMDFRDNMCLCKGGCPDNPALDDIIQKAEQKFTDSLDDDLNISEGLAAVFDYVKDVNRLMADNALSTSDGEKAITALKKFDTVLGVIPEAEELLDNEIECMIQARIDARKNKDWAEADRIRDELTEKGIILEDRPDGTIWKRR